MDGVVATWPPQLLRETLSGTLSCEVAATRAHAALLSTPGAAADILGPLIDIHGPLGKNAADAEVGPNPWDGTQKPLPRKTGGSF